METVAIFVFKLIKGIVLMLVISTVLELIMTGSISYGPVQFLSDFVNSLLQFPVILVDFILCAVFQIMDFVIEWIWDTIPGLSDVFGAPSVSSLFNAC